VPSTVTGNTGVPFVTGSYRPANSGTTDLFPAPARRQRRRVHRDLQQHRSERHHHRRHSRRGSDDATGAGWRFAGAQGATETTFLVLPQTLSTAGPLALPPRGYFLISSQPTTPSPAGNTYSLSTYPTGTGITEEADRRPARSAARR
jgi:hypothetical protein